MALLVPDLERYREFERGFYFDLEESSPGPLFATTDELVEWLRSATDDTPDLAQRRAFRERFCPWDDGLAAVRVVDHLTTAVDEWR
jgi:CDP-glycerol glycerophosphotransferase